METVAVVIGCVISFLLGAYVRSPFDFSSKEDKPEILPEDQVASSFMAELSNILSYNGGEEKRD